MLWFSLFFFMSYVLSFFFLFSNKIWILEWEIFSVSSFCTSVTFIFDFFSFLFFSTVMVIASGIFFFSQFYMDSEKNYKGFVLVLFLFIFSMICLIFSPNIIFLLLGWDGLGVVSYLLVVFYSNYSSSVAGMVTFLVNRLGDVFFFISICFLAFLVDWNFMEMKFSFFLLSMTFILAFITKSAQIPFSSWLPAAMAAPTPVSSLVHSSTLVTAGIFLLIRFFKLVHMSSFWLFFLAVMTIIMAGLMACLDWDMKKIIAFSTLSQLGFMVCSYSCGLVLFTFFHLLTHALFKASLFMCSGILIHSEDNNQDFRNSAMFVNTLPVISVAVVVCLLSLCGFPFSSGFFSKDLILDGVNLSAIGFFFFLVGVVLTFSYSFRFSYYSMTSKMLQREKILMYYEMLVFIMVPVWGLIFLALFSGYFWSETMFFSPVLIFLSLGWKLMYFLIVSLMVGGFILSLKKYFFFLKKYFFSKMWFLSQVFSSFLGGPLLKLSFFLTFILDQGWLETLGGGSGLKQSSLLSLTLFRQYKFSFLLFFFLFFFLFFL